MSTYSKLTYHIVFSTKYRRKTIHDNIRDRLYEYIGGIIRSLEGSLLQIGGTEDHVHILTNLSPTRPVSDCIRVIKANSSKWINELQMNTTKFEWQKGYGSFTVSQSQIATVYRYIENHRVKSFQEEYL